MSLLKQEKKILDTDIVYKQNIAQLLGAGYQYDAPTELIIYKDSGIKTAKNSVMLLAYKFIRFEDEFVCVPTIVVEQNSTYTEIPIELLPRANKDIALWMIVHRKGFLYHANLAGKAISKISEITRSFIQAVKRFIRKTKVEDKVLGFLADLNIIDCDQATLPFHRGDGATVNTTKAMINELIVDFDETRKF